MFCSTRLTKYIDIDIIDDVLNSVTNNFRLVQLKRR